MAPQGLRERKKELTRARIAAAGMELFAERGFDGTTIADIAAAADIAPRTFFAYFPSKEALVFADADEQLEVVRGWLRDRAPGTNLIDALRDGAMAMMGEASEEEHELARARKRLIHETPALRAHSDHLRGRFAEVIAEGVAEQFGESPDDMRPRLVGATTLTAIALIDDSFHASEDPDAEPCEPNDLVATALEFLRGGLEALEAQQGASATPTAG